MSKQFGKLFLIPTLLADNTEALVLPIKNKEVVNSLDYFIVENVRSARRFLVKLEISKPIDSLTFFELNKYSKTEELTEFISPLLNGQNVGLLSEAGMPAIADPGAVIVKMAHEYKIKVTPLTGPSSIMLALAASGLNGQHFTFHGYLPVKSHQRVHKLKQIENDSKKTDTTQVFMETPYRNMQLFEDILKTCNSSTNLCVAVDITSTGEQINTMTISEWKNNPLDLHKRPAIFLLLS